MRTSHGSKSKNAQEDWAFFYGSFNKMNFENPSSAPLIGSPEDSFCGERLQATAIAFDALVKASELRMQIAASKGAETAQSASFLYFYTPIGPMMAAHSGNMFKPMIDWVRSARADHLDAKGKFLLSKYDQDDDINK